MHDRARGGGSPFSGRLFEGPPEARPDADGADHAARSGPGRAAGPKRPDGDYGPGGPYGPEVERRHPPDRRSGLDRRGSGWRAPLQAEPRPYGFREFRARRAVQDRRLYTEDCGSWDAFARRAQRRAQQPAGAARDGFVTLTPEEIVVLVAEADD